MYWIHSDSIDHITVNEDYATDYDYYDDDDDYDHIYAKQCGFIVTDQESWSNTLLHSYHEKKEEKEERYMNNPTKDQKGRCKMSKNTSKKTYATTESNNNEESLGKYAGSLVVQGTHKSNALMKRLHAIIYMYTLKTDDILDL